MQASTYTTELLNFRLTRCDRIPGECLGCPAFEIMRSFGAYEAIRPTRHARPDRCSVLLERGGTFKCVVVCSW